MTRPCPCRRPTTALERSLALAAFAIVLGCAGPGAPASPTGLSCGADAAVCGTAYVMTEGGNTTPWVVVASPYARGPEL